MNSDSTLVPRQDDFGFQNWRTLLLVAALTAASLTPIWITTHFPCQNGPWYLLQVQMFKELGNPAFDYAEYYEINWHPKPHMLHSTLILLVSYVVPLLPAEKVVLSLHAILIPMSIFYFLSSVAPDRKVLGLLSFLMIHTYVFYRGYHDFTLSVPLCFFTFAFWYRHREDFKVRHAIVTAILACLTYLAHLFAFAFLVCAIGYLRLLETRSLRKAVLAAVYATWPGLILAVEHFLLLRSKANWIDAPDTSFLPFHTSLEYLAYKMFYSASFPAYVVATLPWLWIGYLFCRRLWGMKGEQGGFSRNLVRDPLLVLMLTVSLGYFFVPYKILGWHYANIRLIPFILGFGIACSAPLSVLNRRALVRGAFVTTVSLAAFGTYGLLSLKVVEMHRDVEEYVSGITAYAGNCTILPILAENEPFGQIRPITRCHEYYHMARGGANGYGVAECANTLVCVWYRKYPVSETFPKYDRQRAVESMKQIKEIYDYVLLWGEDERTMALLVDHGFHLQHQNGRLRLFRNKAAPVDIAAERRQLDPSG